MISRETLQNLIVFMKRVQVTGEEALAWTQTYSAINAELKALSIPSNNSETLPTQN